MEQSENGILVPGDTDIAALNLIGDTPVEGANKWQEFGVAEEPRGRLFCSIATGKLVGQLHNVGPTSLKATCKHHSKCST